MKPIQRRLTSPGSDLSATDGERLRLRWLGGYLIRTVVTLAGFVLLVTAAVAYARQLPGHALFRFPPGSGEEAPASRAAVR